MQISQSVELDGVQRDLQLLGACSESSLEDIKDVLLSRFGRALAAGFLDDLLVQG